MMRQRTDDEILEDLKDWPVRNIYVESGVRLIEQLRQRVAELEAERDSLVKGCKVSVPTDTMEQWCASEIRIATKKLKEKCEALTAQVGVLKEALQRVNLKVHHGFTTTEWEFVNKALASTPESALSELRRAERERCAKVCEEQYPYTVFHTDLLAAKNCAEAIRAME